MPFLIDKTRGPDAGSLPSVFRFTDVVTVGRHPLSHIRTGPAVTHYRHFAIVRVGPTWVIYDHDDANGTYLSIDDRHERICGGPVVLPDGVRIQAHRIELEFRESFSPLDDLKVTTVAERDWSWAVRPDRLGRARRLGSRAR